MTMQWEGEAMGICPNPRCHRIVVRMADVVLQQGCMEFKCAYPQCRVHAILGEADLGAPPRPRLIVVRTAEAYVRYRAAACARVGKRPPVQPGRHALRA